MYYDLNSSKNSAAFFSDSSVISSLNSLSELKLVFKNQPLHTSFKHGDLKTLQRNINLRGRTETKKIFLRNLAF